MPCRAFGVNTVLIGLHQVGIVGLRDAFKEAEEMGPADRDTILDRLLERLSADNYVPDSLIEAYRTAIWR